MEFCHQDGMGGIASGLLIAATAYLAYVGYNNGSIFQTTVFVGALGGMVHEVLRSNGRFVLPRLDASTQDYYLGGLFGLISGGVAGLLLAQGLPPGVVSTQLIGQAFLAGLGLKSVSEALSAKRPYLARQNPEKQTGQ